MNCEGVCMSQPLSQTHVLLFPFMSKGHTIPILHLARRLLLRHSAAGIITVTLFTTPANLPFVSSSLSDLPPDRISLVTLPFPHDIPGVPPHVESTDQLPTMSLFPEFASATFAMKPHFERSLQSLAGPSPVFLVSDGFLWWTLESASRFGIPRLVFYGMNTYAMAVSRSVVEEELFDGPASDDEPVALKEFPWIKVTKNDFDPNFRKPGKVYADFFANTVLATNQSYGMVVNSYQELESVFLEKWNTKWGPKAWCVGPFCPLEPRELSPESGLRKWLDDKLTQGRRVLYVAFGSQAELSDKQIKEIGIGLENSGVSFLWVMQKKATEEEEDCDGDCSKLDFGAGVKAKVKGQGVVVKGWVDQGAVLQHGSIQGFMSHCGWNSILESICVGVPLLAWPMTAEQPLNARMLTEEIGAAIKVETENGSVRGFVTCEVMERAVRDLMEKERGEAVGKRVAELRDMARKATEPGGSSWMALEDLIANVSLEKIKMAGKLSANSDAN
ncbi:hypothetical protein MLD38_034114 [Melastoma candidum]|uniref:Uncharacterized protein n=1 Tax=Melastoma candidum TaxID=119954 RepID=A0ACB9MB85_9MYRT|nr:hypothetical protein MLD38_034114 [Melastoma candidum]